MQQRCSDKNPTKDLEMKKTINKTNITQPYNLGNKATTWIGKTNKHQKNLEQVRNLGEKKLKKKKKH